MSNIEPIGIGESALQQCRSSFLDGFADLEAAVGHFLRHAGKDSGHPASFSQGLSAFRALEPNSMLAKTCLPKRDKLADQIGELLPLRADIVHSRMEVVRIDGTLTAIFVNVQNRHSEFPLCRLIKLADFESLAHKLARLAGEFGKLSSDPNPASSPPRPSPGAAGGP